MNFLELAVERGVARNWLVLTTFPDRSSDFDRLDFKGLKLIRVGQSGKNTGFFFRALGYLAYYTYALLLLIRYRPGSILYFETLSSFPVVIYRFLSFSKSKIYVHYHEYVSPGEFQSSSWFFRFLHSLERWLYPFLSWFSHTNDERLKMFIRDEPLLKASCGHVMPNYPPKSWQVAFSKGVLFLPLKTVYVGSLSLHSMYLKEFALWVVKQNGNITLDIYSHQPDAAALVFLGGLNSEFIRIHRGVPYKDLPSVLREYDVGLVLYNGHIPNFIWNAPNKLYEYHVNGLDVWVPIVMKGCMHLISPGCYPKFVSVDFSNLDEIVLSDIMNRENMHCNIIPFQMEDALSEILGGIAG